MNTNVKKQMEGKLKLVHTVLESRLRAEDKTLLTKSLLLGDADGLAWPSVERLCRARGMKHEKNFKGADVYLDGLVTTYKVGRKNHYRLDLKAISELEPLDVIIRHTPDPFKTPAEEGLLLLPWPPIPLL